MKARNFTFTLHLHHDCPKCNITFLNWNRTFFLSQPKIIIIFTFSSILFHSILFYWILFYSISRLLFPMFGLLEHSYRIQVRFSQYHLSDSVLRTYRMSKNINISTGFPKNINISIGFPQHFSLLVWCQILFLFFEFFWHPSVIHCGRVGG